MLGILSFLTQACVSKYPLSPKPDTGGGAVPTATFTATLVVPALTATPTATDTTTSTDTPTSSPTPGTPSTVTPLGASSVDLLAQSIVGSGITSYGAVTYRTATNTVGFFSGGMDSVGLDSGIVLSTGLVACASGVTMTNTCDNRLGLVGDADLTALQAGNATFDASALEFDVVPGGNNLRVSYVFTSEEYNQWVSQYQDVFAIFVDGVNIATLPGDLSVSTYNVNACTNTAYYINNVYQATSLCAAMLPIANRPTAMNGLTTVLTATAPVTAGVSCHLKFAIADGKDDWLDSNVFIAAGSLTSF